VTSFRIIPSIEQLRQRESVDALEQIHGADATVEALRDAAQSLRELMHGSREGAAWPETTDAAAAWIEGHARAQLEQRARGTLRPVINATGVILHTNLGRAPLADAALLRVQQGARGYSTLEYDLANGHRGSRAVHAEGPLIRLTGAEAAVVVNNNAAATLLILAGLALGREVIVSRGEMVEIGGGFRVPDVMAQSGARLREVGTTNRTRVADYTAAIGPQTALLLRVHPSNFRIEGFTERPALSALVTAAREAGVPLVEDLGSGCLVDGLAGEPTVQASIAAGVDLVCFSGDKLLGGPQCGIIAGRRDLVDRLRRHPLMRALRVDKLTLAALEGTLLEYAAGRAHAIPVVEMIHAAAEDVEERAQALGERLHDAGWTVVLTSGVSAIGGGSAPAVDLPTVAVGRRPRSASPCARSASHRADRRRPRRARSADGPSLAGTAADRAVDGEGHAESAPSRLIPGLSSADRPDESGSSPEVSPDGRSVACVASRAGLDRSPRWS
jgi:L-seryl-tRNA(Ser) seleniumtransferase